MYLVVNAVTIIQNFMLLNLIPVITDYITTLNPSDRLLLTLIRAVSSSYWSIR